MNRYLITSLYIETPQCLNNEAICSTDEYARVIFPHKIRILQYNPAKKEKLTEEGDGGELDFTAKLKP